MTYFKLVLLRLFRTRLSFVDVAYAYVTATAKAPPIAKPPANTSHAEFLPLVDASGMTARHLRGGLSRTQTLHEHHNHIDMNTSGLQMFRSQEPFPGSGIMQFLRILRALRGRSQSHLASHAHYLGLHTLVPF